MQSNPLQLALCGVTLKNPVIAASGTFGFGHEYAEVMDISRETKETLASYGADPSGASFANNCLLARRLAEHNNGKKGSRYTRARRPARLSSMSATDWQWTTPLKSCPPAAPYGKKRFAAWWIRQPDP